MTTADVPVQAAPEQQGYGERVRANVRSGNLGSAPVILALALVWIFFYFWIDNFATPINFTNLIGQMAGTCLVAYGVVFVLLIGEIDLSIGFVSGIAGMTAAMLQQPSPIGPGLPGWLPVQRWLNVVSSTLYSNAGGPGRPGVRSGGTPCG